MRKIFFFGLAVLLFVGNVFSGGVYSGGDGSEGNPFLIDDADDMQEIGAHSEDWWACFLMVDDVDLGGFTGSQFNIIQKEL